MTFPHVVHNLRTGKVALSRSPEPLAQPGHVLIANSHSVISAGTEKMVLELGRKSLLGKARERPDQVRRILDKMRNEGILNTIGQISQKLDEPMPLGYVSAGVVLACGEGVRGLRPGDRVASNGPHAGIVSVPRHLCVLVPDKVPLDHAAYTTLAAIALQGIRLANVGLGSSVLVIGLGLIGQIAVSLLRANGCRVFGTDLDPRKCERAIAAGAEAASPSLDAAQVASLTRGLGADAVLITASTPSNGPVELAADAVRKKGKIVALGAVGLTLPRRPFYFKEAEFVVSCSYGPGRYDPEYEERNHDYPAAYVRWTEERNMQAVLDLMASGSIDLRPLTTHRFSIEKAEEAYAMIEGGRESYLGIVLDYPAQEPGKPARRVERTLAPSSDKPGIGVLGAGNFARMTLLPAIRKSGLLRPRILGTAGGVSAAHEGEKLDFEVVTTEETQVFSDRDVAAVFILTRHSLHAAQVVAALKAGKHVYVEKPLALTEDEVAQIEAALLDSKSILMVGFNRRFSPAAQLARRHFAEIKAPVTVSIRMNVGTIPEDHWTQAEEVGGGRIIGEACHAIDLATYLAGSPPVRVFGETIGGPQAPVVTHDQSFITLRHANGSISSIGYLAGGDKSYPKERIEILGGGKMAIIDDFKECTLVSGGKGRRVKSWQQDKGFQGQIEAFAASLARGGASPIPWEDLRAVSLAAILAVRSIREGSAFDIP